jgi:hypothetical protein
MNEQPGAQPTEVLAGSIERRHGAGGADLQDLRQ